MKITKMVISSILVMVLVFSFASALATSNTPTDCGGATGTGEAVSGNFVSYLIPGETEVAITTADEGTQTGKAIKLMWCSNGQVRVYEWTRHSWMHAAVAQLWESNDTSIKKGKLYYRFTVNEDLALYLYFDKGIAVLEVNRAGVKENKQFQSTKVGDTFCYWDQNAWIDFLGENLPELEYDLEHLHCPAGSVSVSKMLFWLTTQTNDHNVAEGVVQYTQNNQCEPVLYDYFTVDYTDENGEDVTLHSGRKYIEENLCLDVYNDYKAAGVKPPRTVAETKAVIEWEANVSSPSNTSEDAYDFWPWTRITFEFAGF